jgi:hypothetical protein
MPRYTMRPSFSHSRPRPNDYVFRVNGIDAGRCYLRRLANNEPRWSWTIYIGVQIKTALPNVPIEGTADTSIKPKRNSAKASTR